MTFFWSSTQTELAFCQAEAETENPGSATAGFTTSAGSDGRPGLLSGSGLFFWPT